MNPIATVVSVQGSVWAQSPDGTVRQLTAGDQVMADDVLISAAGSQIVLDFGDGAPVTLTGEQVTQMADSVRASVAIDPDESQLTPETAEILERLLGPLPEGSNFGAMNEDSDVQAQGFGFVELARIGQQVEADGINPLRLLRTTDDLQALQTDPLAIQPITSHDTGGRAGDGTIYAQGNNHTGYPGSITPPPMGLPPSGTITVNIPDIDAANQADVIISGTVENIPPGTSIDITITDKNGNTVTTTTVVRDDLTYQVPTDLTELTDGDLTADVTVVDQRNEPVTTTDTATKDTVPGDLQVNFENVDNEANLVDISGRTTDVAAGAEVTLVVTDGAGGSTTVTVTVDESGNYRADNVDITGFEYGNLYVDATTVDTKSNTLVDDDQILFAAPPGDITVSIDDIDPSGSMDLSGTTKHVPPGSTIEIVITDKNGTEIELTTTVNEDGSYNVPGVDITGLVDGPVEVVAKTEDVGDKEITATDHTTLDLVPGAITVNIPNVDESNVTAVKITGTTKDVPPGSSVSLRISDEEGSTVTRTVTVDENGNYELTVDLSRLTDGQITVDASSRDNNDNPVTARDQTDKVIPEVEPEPEPEPLPEGYITVDIPSLIPANATSVQVTGSTYDVPAGSIVSITITDSRGSSVVVNATVDSNGNYQTSANLSGMQSGSVSASATVTDTYGQSVWGHDSGVIDAAPIIPPGNLSVQFDHVDSAAATADISGTTTRVAPGQTVTLRLTDQYNKVQTYTAVVQSSGSFSISGVDVSMLADGDIRVTARATALNGGTVSDSDTGSLNAVTSDIKVTMDDANGDNQTAVPIRGTTTDVGAGKTVVLEITDTTGNTVIVNATVQSDGTYTSTADVSGLDNGPLTVVATTTDNNGVSINDTDTADKNDQSGAIYVEFDNLDEAGLTVDIVGRTVSVNDGEQVTLVIEDQAGNIYTVPGGATVQPDGTYTVTGVNISSLIDGPLTITATTTDAAGHPINGTDDTVLNGRAGSITVEIDSINDTVGTIDISGTTVDVYDWPANDEVTLTITDKYGVVVTVETTVDGSGNYSVTGVDITSLTDGPITVTAKAVDNNGNPLSDNDSGELDYLEGQVTVNIIDVTDVNQGAVPISGTTVDVPVGSIVELVITDTGGGEVRTTATVGTNGNYLVTEDLSLLLNGPLTVVARTEDNNGNTVTGNDDSVKTSSAETIVVQFDSVDNAAHTVNISGNVVGVSAGQDVDLTIVDQDGNEIDLTVQVDGTGAYVATDVDVSTLVDGPITVTAVTVNTGGFTISDTDDSELDAWPGALKIDTVTVNDGGPTLDITGDTTDVPPGATVTIVITDQDNNKVTAITQVNPDGSYDLSGIDISTLVDGPLDIEASATDRNGTSVDDSAVDELNHVLGTITVDLPNVNSGNETMVPISGTTTDVEPGAIVTLVIKDQFGDDETVTTTVNADGSYLVLVDLSGLADGDLTVDASATDRNSATVTDDDDATKDAEAGNIAVEVDSVNDTAGTIDISGTTVNVNPGEMVELVITDQNGISLIVPPADVIVQAGGSYAIADVNVSGLTDGPLTITAEAVDLNGNAVDDQTTAVLDHVLGGLTIENVVVDNTGPTLDIDGGTTDVPPNSTVTITITDKDGNTVVVTTTTNNDGDYDLPGIDISTLVDGPLDIEATSTDNNGDPVDATGTGDLDYIDGAITVNLPDVNSGNEKAVPISGITTDVPTGETVTLEITDGATTVTVVALVQSDGSYSTTADLSGLNNGGITVEATSTDNNGKTVDNIDTAMKNAVAGRIQVEVDNVDHVSALLDLSGTTSNVNVGEQITLTITDQYNTLPPVVVTTTALVGGTYSVTGVDISSLTDGELTILAETTDLSGNAVDDTTTTVLDHVTGDLTIDNVTVNDGGPNPPTLDIDGGTTDVPPNSTVTITITDQEGNTVVVTTTTDNNGDYDLPGIDISTLVDGPLVIEATSTDNNGDPVGATGTGDLDYTDGAITVEMPNVNDGNESQVPISGTTTDVAPGEIVTLIITDQFGDVVNASTTVNADGSYVVLVDLSGLADGDLTVDASATDRNGATVTDDDDATKDAEAANITVQVDGVDDTAATIDISGTTVNVNPGEMVELVITDQNGISLIIPPADVIVQADGSYAITDVDVSGLTDGPLTITAEAVDLNGNAVDDQTSAVLDHVPGGLTIDNVVVDNTGPTLDIDGGTTDVPPNSTVTITITDKEGNTVVVTTTTDNNGDYDRPGVDISTLVDGPLEVEASTTDNNGKTVDDFTTDELDYTDGAITVDLPDVNSGNEKDVPISGTTTDVPAGGTVTLDITDGTTTVSVTATVQSDGSYSTTVDLSGLSNGNITVDASSTDNNSQPVNATDTAMKNAVAGSIDVTGTVDDLAGTIDISGTTSNVNVDEVVTLTITDQYGNTLTVPGPVEVQVGGTYSIAGVDVSSLSDGPLTIYAETTDLSGNAVDDTTATVLDHVTGDLTIDNVTVNDGGPNPPTLDIDGGTTDVPPNSTVTITITDKDGNTVVVTTTTNNDGDYDLPGIDISTLVDGPLVIEATSTDNNGDPVGATGTGDLDYTDGAITVEMPNVNDGNESQVPISGTTTDVAPGEIVTLIITDQFGDVVNASTTVNADGSYVVLVDLSGLADGDLTVDASATDRNGATVTDDDDATKDAEAGNITVQVDSVDHTAATIDIRGTTVNVNPGEKVVIVVTDQTNNSITVLGPVEVQGDGSYIVTGVGISSLIDGPLTIVAETVDLNGNDIDDTTVAVLDHVDGELTLTIDEAGISTDVNGDTIMPVNGTTEDVPENAIVTITVTDQYGNTATGTGTVQSDGTYTSLIDISELADGPLEAVATTTDNNGEPLEADDDTILDERAGEITVAMDDVDDTNVTGVPITGTTTDIPEGATVTLLITDQFGVTVYTTAQVINVDPKTGAGEYVTTADVAALADGELEVEARAMDNNGVLRTDTDDSTKDSVTSDITIAMDDVTEINVTTVAITGTTADVEPGTTIALTITDANNDTVIVSAIVQSDGSYHTTANVSTLADGDLEIEASALDQNGATITATDDPTKDTTPPELTITAVAELADGASTTITFTFTEDITGFDVTDIIAMGGTIDSDTFTQVSGSEWTIEFTADGSGPINISVADGDFADLVGNAGIGDSLPINNIPVGTPAVDAAEDGDVYTFEASTMFADVEAGTLTYSVDLTSLPAGFTFNPTTGLISGTLASDASQEGTSGVYTISVTATDSEGASTSADLVLTVTNPDPITTAALPDIVGDDNETLMIPTASVFHDPDGDDLSYTILVDDIDAADASIVSTLGLISINADGVISVDVATSASQGGASASGEYVITVIANDNQGGEVDTDFILTVNNPVPVVTPLPGEVREDGEIFTIDASQAFTDEDALTYSFRVLGTDAEDALGDISIDPTGTITIELDRSASQGGTSGLGDGVYRIEITATDADGAAVTDIVDVTVHNPAPVFDSLLLRDVVLTDSDTLDNGDPDAEDEILTHQAFTDPDGDTLSFTATGLPEGLIMDSQGVITGTLLHNASQGGDAVDGVYTIVVTADDGEGGITTGTFTLTVHNADVSAIADIDDTDQDTPISVDPNKSVVDNDDPDGDGDDLVVTHVSNGADTYGPSSPITGTDGGIFVIHPDGTYSFDPNGDFDHLGLAANGDPEELTTSVTYTISDGQGGTDTATLTITVTGVNDAPEAEDDHAITGINDTVNIDVLANDTDIDTSDQLTVTHINGVAITEGTPLPIAGGHTVTLLADGTLDFTPAADFDGPVDFDYTVSDSHGESVDATVNVKVISIDIKDNASLSAPGVIDNTQGDDVLASIDNLAATVFTGLVPQGGAVVSVTISGPGAPDIVLGVDDIWVLADGTFHLTTNTVDVRDFDDGDLTITLVAQDVHGNQATTTDTILKDTVTEVTIDPLLVVNGDVPTITGTGEPNSTITIWIDEEVEGTTTVDGDGNWSFDNPVPGDVFEIQADAEDQWGNVNDENGDPARDVREVPSLSLNIDQLTVLESGLPNGSSPDPDDTDKAGSFSFNTHIDALSHIVVHGTEITVQELLDLGANALNPIETEYGEIEITAFDSTTNTVTYEYRLTGNTEDHSPATGNDEVSEDIVIEVEDSNGDIRRDTLEVIVVDDVPTAVDLDPRSVTEGDDPLTNTIDGNVITDIGVGGVEDIVGADGARVHVIFYTDRDGDPATATVTEFANSPDGSVTVETQYGALTVHSNGDWTYTSVRSAYHDQDHADDHDEEVPDDFSYTLIDNDGDISNQATQPIGVLDTVPEVDSPEDNVVREEHFPSGSHPNPDPDELTQTGSLGVIPGADAIVTTFDEEQSVLDALITDGLTSGGLPVTYTVSDDDGNGNGYVLTATAGGNPVFTVTITDPTDAAAAYEFELHRPLDHHDNVNEAPGSPADPNEPGRIDLKFNFTVTDSDNDQDDGIFTITVVDDIREDDAQEIEVDEDDEITFITTADGTAANTTIHTDDLDLKAPEFGTITLESDGRITYIPNGDYSGEDSFEYEINQNGNITKVMVTVTVNPVSDEPLLEVDDDYISTLEDTPIALGLKAPVIVDDTDQSPTVAGDWPERLGEITLSGLPEDSIMTFGANTYTVDANETVTIELFDLPNGQHISNVDPELRMLTADFEAMTITPPPHSHENFTVEMSVTSYEVDGAGVKLPDVDGEESTTEVEVRVQAVTDDVELTFNTGATTVDNVDDVQYASAIEANVTIKEDTSFNLKDILAASFEDLDGSENRWITIENTTGQTIMVNGSALAPGAERTIDAEAGEDGQTGKINSFPSIILGAEGDYSGDLKGINITINAQDYDADGWGTGSTPANVNDPGIPEADISNNSVTLNLYVTPVAGDVNANSSHRVDEDNPVAFLSGIEVTDTDGSEIITGISFTIPTDGGTWTITKPGSGENTDWQVLDVGGEYTIAAVGPYDLQAILDDFQITPPAHSSLDAEVTVSVTTQDTAGTESHSATTDHDVSITVTPVAEVIDGGGSGTVGDDLTMTEGFDYTTPGEEDEWFDLNADGFDLSARWVNQDADEITYARLTPELIAGDGSQANANGSQFEWAGSGGPVTFTGEPIDVPVTALGSLQFKAAPNFAGMFRIKVQAYTVDYDDDNEGSGTPADAVSGEAWLTNVLIHPVADEVSLAVRGMARGLEDTEIRLRIFPQSSDQSETFEVTISDIPEGATLTYDGVAQLVVDGEATIEDFDDTKLLTITPPLDSNEDFLLKVSAVSVDTLFVPDDPANPDGPGTTYTSPPSPVSQELTIDVRVKGVPDEPIIDIQTYEVSEDVVDGSTVDANGDGNNMVALSNLITSVQGGETVVPSDESETIRLHITGLPEGIDLIGASFLGFIGGGSDPEDRAWLVSEDQLANAKLVLPANFSGTLEADMRAVVTESDGASRTFPALSDPATKLTLQVTPTPEATLQTSSSLSEDTRGAVDFSLIHQNGDDDETLESVWINKDDADAGVDFKLYLGGSELQAAGLTVVTDGGEEWYVLTGTDIDNVSAQGAPNDHGSYSFRVRYEVTDEPEDESLPAVTQQFNGAHTLNIASVTDPATLVINSITAAEAEDADINGIIGAEVIRNTDITVNLTLSKDPDSNAGGEPDYDGSEQITSIVIDGVPTGVVIVDATYIGNIADGAGGAESTGRWFMTPPAADLEDDYTFDIVFKLVGEGAQMEWDPTTINISVTTQDWDDPEDHTARVSWELSLDNEFDDDDATSSAPATILPDGWADDPGFVATEDVPFSLSDAVVAAIDGSSAFSITITNFPEGTVIDGMTQTTVNGVAVWTASGTGDNNELMELLDSISITLPPDWNSNNLGLDRDPQFHATLTTQSTSGERDVRDIVVIQPVTPVTDPATLDVSAPAVEEGMDVVFTIDISNPEDGGDEFSTVMGDGLYLQVSTDPGMEGGTLVDSNGDPLGTVVNPDGLPPGTYYVVPGVRVDEPVQVTYQSPPHGSGGVTLNTWIRTQEDGASNIETGHGSVSTVVTAVNSGYEFSGLNPNEPVLGTEDDDFIELPQTGGGLVDDDGSESVLGALLKNVPEEFLVFYGDDADTAQLASNAGGGTWSIPTTSAGELPAFIALVPPQDYNTAEDGAQDVTLTVLTQEAALSEIKETDQVYTVTVEPVADGITLNPTSSFGTEGGRISLNLNAAVLDAKEKVAMTIEGLGEHAALYADGVLLNELPGAVVYDSANGGTYTLTGLTPDEVDSLEFLQAAGAISSPLTVTARTVDGTDVSVDVTEPVTVNVSPALATNDNNELLYVSGQNLDGLAGVDTVKLRYGQDLDSADYSNLSNIEIIDLGMSGANSLSNLTLQDVLDMTDANNKLIIEGDSADSVELLDVVDAAWTLITSDTHPGNPNLETGYKVYENTGNPSAVLLIEDGITIIE